MRTIDLQSWPRRHHFEAFKDFHEPRFDMCANVDLTAFRPVVKEVGSSFTIAILYVITRAANSIPAFRQRIRGEAVIEHDVVNPSSTILVDDDLFSFATYEYDEDYPTFADGAAAEIAKVRRDPWIRADQGRDDLFYMTAIPWVSFTSFRHASLAMPADSVPRMAWGKAFERDGRTLMPLEIEAHHAVVDGLHVGRFYETVQGHLDRPGAWLR